MAVTKRKSKAQPVQQKTKVNNGNINKDKPAVKKRDLQKTKRAFVPVPEHNGEQEDEEIISEDDLEYFEQNRDFGRFLKALDPKELSRNTSKKVNTDWKPEKTKKQKVEPKGIPEPPADMSSSGEEDYDDEDLEGLINVATDDDLDELEADQDEEVNSDDDNDTEHSDAGVASDLDQVSDQDIDIDDMLEDEMEQDLRRPRPKKQKKTHASDEEEEYEKAPRHIDEWTKKDFHDRLPIKLPGGRLAQIEEPSEDEDEKMDEAPAGKEHDKEEEEEKPMEEAPKLSKKERALKKKEELADIATLIQEDPYVNVKKLGSLRAIYNDENPNVRKLALLTQLSIYLDIIPGYRIRELTEEEANAKVTKEVKLVRDFEKALLVYYELFLKDLGAILTKQGTEKEDASFTLIATRCLCELLTKKTHFNFRLEILLVVVQRMSTLEWNEVADLACKAIIEVFENDEAGRTSLDAVQMITRMIKTKSYLVHENVVRSFLHLRLKDEMTPVNDSKAEEQRGQKRKKVFMNKKAKKALKETKAIEKEMKEAEAVVDKEEKEKNHSETLKLIFAFYFRLLKKQASSPLMPSVLEGLGKFSHLISVDFFEDILKALKDVLDGLDTKNDPFEATQAIRKRILCIITAFELMSGQSEKLLNYDLKAYYDQMYNIMFHAAFHTKLEEAPAEDQDSESELILKSLELMFLKRRQMPIHRIAAFVKRLSTVSLNMPSKTVTSCLQLIRRLTSKDRRLDALTQSEDKTASGVYLPYLEDPDLCNPLNTSLYELFLLKDHYDPQVRALAQSVQQPPTV